MRARPPDQGRDEAEALSWGHCVGPSDWLRACQHGLCGVWALPLPAGGASAAIASLSRRQLLAAGAYRRPQLSPDGASLVLAVATGVCSSGEVQHAILRVDVTTLVTQTLVEPDSRCFVPQAWPEPGRVLLIWLGGVVCLWLTRYTHQLGKRWGRLYYAFSALIRPAGVLLIAVGWLALYAPANVPAPLRRPGLYLLPWLPMRSLTEVLSWLAALGFTAFGVWALVTLGLRRSFLYRHVDDRLITWGPYALVRHPQFLATIGMTFFATRVFQPQGFPFFGMGGYIHSVDANWMLFTLALWVLAVLEDRELAAHFPEYSAYAQRVPRLFPN